jgi:hypothetical protein
LVAVRRFTTRVQLTQPFSGELGSYVALVYANKPEYLGDVDRTLRANLGLSYKLPAGLAP